MKCMRWLPFFFSFAFAVLACSGKNDSNPDGGKEPDNGGTTTSTFAKGADISWVTEMEHKGMKFYNASGVETDCFQLMKVLGLNAVRLRVWVDPKEHGNWCNTADFVAKAKRAKDLGMDVMVDFHYSDWWADPGQQHKPAVWKGLNLADLKKAIATHTTDVLNALKSEGVTPKWVQVGNEIRPGMLWDEDVALSGASYDVRECDVKDSGSISTKVKYPKNLANLAAFINAGYDAVKTVFPNTIAIVHLDNGYDQSLYTWFFDELKKNGGKWDMIGMSLYPYWTMLEYKDYTPEKTITDCIENIKKVSAKYNCDVMVVETGMECADDDGKLVSTSILTEGKRQLARILKECKEKTNGRCKGVFYWEPECRPSQYRLGAFTENGYPTVIMDAFK
ncbi:glycosyl hydrolase 53 family protein [Bacteroides sp.]|uniref:glycoside hydrolase family 53 protein n=1 Tax=Bacteroides sp. TaxID=29523 RepID=UPI00261C3ACA|nr:glycosyl hydrolase 53 family protein [Bacteroides sp.]